MHSTIPDRCARVIGLGIALGLALVAGWTRVALARAAVGPIAGGPSVAVAFVADTLPRRSLRDSVLRDSLLRDSTMRDSAARAAVSAMSDTLPPPRTTDSASRATGTLRQGDILQLKVYRDSELSGTYLIEANGNVQIPGLGVVRAAGLRPEQVSRALVDALRARGFNDPELAIRTEINVSLLGEVHKPLLYAIDPGLSLIQLITMAGGPTDAGDLRKVRVVRDGRVFVVDVQSALDGGPAGRIALYSNDVVYVPKKGGLTRQTTQFLISLIAATLALATTIIVIAKN